eukprot:UN24588
MVLDADDGHFVDMKVNENDCWIHKMILTVCYVLDFLSMVYLLFLIVFGVTQQVVSFSNFVCHSIFLFTR